MIIPITSPLRNIPTQWEYKEALALSSILFFTDSIDSAYSGLINDLSRPFELSEREHQVRIANNLWGYIDAVDGFYQVFKKHFYVEDEFEWEIKKIRKIRNSYQHIECRINEIFHQSDFALFGSLSWFINSVEECIGKSFFLRLGIYDKDFQGRMIVNESNLQLGILFRYVIKENSGFDEIEISLDNLFNEITDLVSSFEQRVIAVSDINVNDTYLQNYFVWKQ